MLIDAIKTHALEAAQSADWSAVAATLQAVSVTAPARVCWAVESGAAATAAGGDHTELLTAMLGDPNGTMLFQRLSSGIGVEWAHPVTVPYLQSLVSAGKMTQQVMDALIQLSAPTTFPHVEVTAEECQRSWIIDSCLAPISAAHAAAAAKFNNAHASLGPEHTDGLTLEQLQLRCDAITASVTGEV
jgi:hypothetical protein